jgi:hypothetical protein
MSIIKFIANSEFLKKNLQEGTLFFNSVNQFNDPFEGGFRYKVDRDYEKFKDFYVNKYSGNPEKLAYHFAHIDEFEQQLNINLDWRYANNGITCFSDQSNEPEILMWAHYAKNHDGVCLHFNREELKFTPIHKIIDNVGISDPTGPYQIKYTDEYLNEDPSTRDINAGSFLTTKFTPWNYEKESRYIAPKPGPYYFKASALTEVVFGLRFKPEHRNELADLIADQYPQAKITKIELQSSSFKFRKTDYKPPSDRSTS